MNINELVCRALDEDIGAGDVTTETCVSGALSGIAYVKAKQELVLCGQNIAPIIFAEVSRRYGGDVIYTEVVRDGTFVTAGTVVAEVRGPLRSLLIGERITLNFMMKLSGIATNVRSWVEAAGPTGPKIVDTRKTTPLLRAAEKYAVRCGGGRNHRMGLYDGVMIKDNHITSNGSISGAVSAVRASIHHLLKIEVEVKDVTELREAMEAGADVVLLDNMSDGLLAECVEVARSGPNSVVLEASGNMNPARIQQICHLDLDFISAGGLIHQARWVDLSMKIVEKTR